MIRIVDDAAIRITVPLHDPVKKGTLRAIISQSGLSVEEFIRLM